MNKNNIENIGPVFGGPTADQENPKEVSEALEEQKLLNQTALDILKTLSLKDPTAKFNVDRIAGSLQAIAFTKNGRIMLTNSLEKIFIEQDGKGQLTFDLSQKEEALNKLKEIVASI